MIRDPEYEAWLATVPPTITEDAIWRMTVYRYALYAMSRAQADLPDLQRCRESRPHIDQLLRAVGGISANLEEGYGRSGVADRAHFFEYAVSTARESRGWFYRCGRALSAETEARRIHLFRFRAGAFHLPKAGRGHGISAAGRDDAWLRDPVLFRPRPSACR